MAILDELIGDDVFTESDWSEEDEPPVFNISILDIYKKAELTDDNNSIFKWVSKYLFNDSGYCYELRKMTYDHIVKNDDFFSKYLQDQSLTRYVEKMRPGNSSGGKLELIGLSSLFEINIIVFHLLTQEKPQLVVENNYTDKQVVLLKEDKEQYSLLIHKTEKVKYSIYKRPQIVEMNE